MKRKKHVFSHSTVLRIHLFPLNFLHNFLLSIRQAKYRGHYDENYIIFGVVIVRVHRILFRPIHLSRKCYRTFAILHWCKAGRSTGTETSTVEEKQKELHLKSQAHAHIEHKLLEKR